MAIALSPRRSASYGRPLRGGCLSLAVLVVNIWGEPSGAAAADCWQGDGRRAAECCGGEGGGDGAATCFSTGLHRSSCCPAAGLKETTCLFNASGVESWGRLAAWFLEGTSGGGRIGKSDWVELLVLRPILVGWRQGYKGRTFRVIASSGPLPAEIHVPFRVPQSTALPIGMPLRPGDVVGWRHYHPDSAVHQSENEATRSVSAVDDELGAAWCIGAKGCDDTGLCRFDTPLHPGSPLWRVSLEVWQRSAPRSSAVQDVLPGLDLSGLVEVNTTYEEFLTLRSALRDPSLHLFEDKIRLRRELLPSLGVEATPSILLTNTEPERVLPSIRGLRSYVVKPSHMSESQNVFVVQDGIDLLRRAWGQPEPVATPELVQATVNEFMHTTALDWECKALVTVPAGVVVEELVLSTLAGGLAVDEYKFYTVWGEVVFGESVPFSSGAAMWIDREGGVLVSRSTCPPHCVAPCYGEMVRLVERVARGARTDFLRVDLLVRGHCEGLFVSEVELFPASEFDPVLRDAVADRWRQGYGLPR